MIPEVEWLLTVIGPVVDSVATDYDATVVRVDRNTPRVYRCSGTLSDADSRRTKEVGLEHQAAVGVAYTEESSTPIGIGYDYDIERTASLRVEGVHLSDHGAIDPDGDHGVPFGELWRRVRRALLAERTHPDVGRPNTRYRDLVINNVTDRSPDNADYYRTDADVVFRGYETV